MSNVYRAPFYMPQPVGSQPDFPVADGDIFLLKDDNWDSEKLKLNIYDSDFPEGMDRSFAGTPLQDAATWIAYNLPKGVVCTLTDNVLVSRSNKFNFAGAGICVDLIGTGKKETVHLPAYGANDCLSGAIWRRVDESEGWIQLFEDVNQDGPFNTIFAAEWPTGPLDNSEKDPSAGWNSLAGWYLDDKISSINYPCLTPPQLINLATEHNGSGATANYSASNEFGKFDNPATANFTDNGFNDRIHAFKWTLYAPVKAGIKSVSQSTSVALPPDQIIEESVVGNNNKSAPIDVELSIAEGQQYSITNTTQLQYSMSIGLSVSVSASSGVPDNNVSATVTSSFTATFGQTFTKTSTKTQTFNLGQKISLTIPPNTQNYKASARVGYADLPLQTETIIGEFFYSQKLPGAVAAPGGLWRLDSPIIVNTEGGIGTQVAIDVGA